VLGTAVSDLEVVSEEEDGFMWHITYPFSDGPVGLAGLTVATTRPETMLGDVAVMVHPEDERYAAPDRQDGAPAAVRPRHPDHRRRLRRPRVRHRLRQGHPAHDFNDYAVGQRHQLPMISILTLDAHINDDAPEKYRGMDRFVAREASSPTSKRSACSWPSSRTS
jgi:valyl-tRNA synthetase